MIKEIAMKKSLILLAFLFFISGCDLVLQTVLKLTDLTTGKSKDIQSELYLELTSCHDYEDSRNQSSSLVKAKQMIPYVFKNAKYIECYSKNFKSYAHFSVPITIDKHQDGKFASSENINFVSTGNGLLSIGIPDEVKQKMEQVKRDSLGLDKLDLKINITLTNDTKDPFKINALSVYLDEKPIIWGNFILEPSRSANLRLSNVSVDHALTERMAFVLYSDRKG